MSQNKPKKTRLDLAVFERGHTESREKAKALIMAGAVYVNGQKQLKAGTNVTEDDVIEVRGEKMPYVSRGGFKLEKAMNEFGLTLEGKVCMDIGASTGGFTDCMLQNGAVKVYSIDVGYGQLAWKLRTDERVVNLERTNFRYVTEEQVPEPVDFASVDVSFISLRIILPVLRERLRDGGQAVCLIKPQFEAGKGQVGKNGVVREKETHERVLREICLFAPSFGWHVQQLTYSPIKGPAGNIEFLADIRPGEGDMLTDDYIKELVQRAHTELK